MAARRLIIVMLVLLGVSTAIAIVVPEPRTEDPTEETGTTGATGASGATGSTGAAGPGGDGPDTGGTETIDATFEGGKESSEVVARPGDRVILTVETAEPTDVVITGLGLTQTTSKFAPAVFDLIIPPGRTTYPVTDFATGKNLGEIVAGGKKQRG